MTSVTSATPFPSAALEAWPARSPANEAGFYLQTAASGSRYPLLCGAGLLAQLPQHLEAVGLPSGKRLFIITDANVAPLYLDKVTALLEAAGYNVHSHVCPAGEPSKSFARMEQILREALGHNLTRKDAFLALGGGIVGDLTGYCAASYHRGTAFVQVPTTLLAMVDSSVGGKVGINLDAIKNAIGAFYQPKLVLMDTEALATLPEREFKAGLAEIAKYALIENNALAHAPAEAKAARPLLESLLNEPPKQRGSSPQALRELILRCCELKAYVVRADERETASALDATGRICLNLGHTFGHALETACAATPGKLLHGEAVAMGLLLAASLSLRLGLWEPPALERVHALLQALAIYYPQLPLDLEQLSPAQLVAWMRQDKKNLSSQSIRLIVPGPEPGSVEVRVLEELALLEACFAEYPFAAC